MNWHSLYDKNKRGRIQEQLRRGELSQKKPAPEPSPGSDSHPVRDIQEYRRGGLTVQYLDHPAYAPLSSKDRLLLVAVVNSDHAQAGQALAAGANPDIRDSLSACETVLAGVQTPRNHGNTALMIATLKGDLLMVQLLIRFKADVNLDFAIGSCPFPTALTYAREKGFTDIERELVAAGAVR